MTFYAEGNVCVGKNYHAGRAECPGFKELLDGHLNVLRVEEPRMILDIAAIPVIIEL